MDSQVKELSYFKIRLQELLNTSFPELAYDIKFIEQRSSWAASAYEGAFRSGNSTSQCEEVANFILFEGLHFSKFDAVFEVVCNEFDALMPDEELRLFALKMLAVCSTVFSNYELPDDFYYDVEYDLLYSELTGTIAIWIEKNGLQ